MDRGATGLAEVEQHLFGEKMALALDSVLHERLPLRQVGRGPYSARHRMERSPCGIFTFHKIHLNPSSEEGKKQVGV